MNGTDLPPHVTVDADGVSASVPPGSRVRWRELERVVIQTVTGGAEYSEAFWVLTGGGQKLVAPVEIVMGAEQLNAWLLALPGFDTVSLAQARLAEAASREGEFLCWERPRPRPWWKLWKR